VIELFKLALRSVGKRKKRAALTMLGVFVGIAAVVALVSLGQGLSDTINTQFEKIGADKIFVQAKEQGFGGQFAPGQLREREFDIVEDVNGVVQVAGALFRTVRVKFNNLQKIQYIITNPEDEKEVALMRAVNTWEVVEGRLLEGKDSGKAVIGHTLANKEVFGKKMRIGNKVILDDVKFDIVGVLKRVGDPFADSGIIISEADARLLLNESEAYSYLIAQSAKTENPEVVGKRIEKAHQSQKKTKEHQQSKSKEN